MAYDEALAVRIRSALARRKGFVEKKMFGGVGFLLNGNMCVGIWKDFLIVRLDPEAYDLALAEPHVEKFDITGKAMSGWVMVGPDGIGAKDLKKWIERAISYVSALPKKAKAGAPSSA